MVEMSLMQKLGEAASKFEQAYNLMMGIIGGFGSRSSHWSSGSVMCRVHYLIAPSWERVVIDSWLST